jgi:hypothetical protein
MLLHQAFLSRGRKIAQRSRRGVANAARIHPDPESAQDGSRFASRFCADASDGTAASKDVPRMIGFSVIAFLLLSLIDMS